MMKKMVLHARSLFVGRCESDGCHAVHLDLYNGRGQWCARASLDCDQIDGVVADLLKARDSIMALQTVH